MNFYKRHIGDIGKSCGHLSQGQMGAYDLLLDWIYGNEKPLPLSPELIYRIARAHTKAERDNVTAVLQEFFVMADDGYTQKRATKEIIKASIQADTNRRIAEAREAAKRARKEHESFNGSCTNRQPSQTPDSRHQTPEEAKEEKLLSPAGPGTTPHAEIVSLYHDLLPSLPQMRTWPEDRQALLRARWREEPERQSLDWWREFFAYVAGCPFLLGQTNSPGRDPFYADLEWLLRPKNFRKVIEGKYEARA